MTDTPALALPLAIVPAKITEPFSGLALTGDGLLVGTGASAVLVPLTADTWAWLSGACAGMSKALEEAQGVSEAATKPLYGYVAGHA